jgi:hypothetical protein
MPHTPQQKQTLLDCLDAMAEAEEDAHDSGEDSDDHGPDDDVALDHAYEVACLRTESRKTILAMLKDQIATMRRVNVCSWVHGLKLRMGSRNTESDASSISALLNSFL